MKADIVVRLLNPAYEHPQGALHEETIVNDSVRYHR